MVPNKKRSSQDMNELIQTDQVLSMEDDFKTSRRQKYLVSSNDNQKQPTLNRKSSSGDVKTMSADNQKTFLFCHLYMLRSLYSNSISDSNLQHDSVELELNVNDDIWKLIEQFLRKQTELENIRTKAKYLNDVYEESKYINFGSDSKIFSNKTSHVKKGEKDSDDVTTPSSKQPNSNNLYFQNPQYISKYPLNDHVPCTTKNTKMFLNNILCKKSCISDQKAKEAFLPYLSLLTFVQMLCCKLRTRYHEMNIDLKKKYGIYNCNHFLGSTTSKTDDEDYSQGTIEKKEHNGKGCRKKQYYFHMSKVEELKIKISLWHLLYDSLKSFQN